MIVKAVWAVWAIYDHMVIEPQEECVARVTALNNGFTIHTNSYYSTENTQFRVDRHLK